VIGAGASGALIAFLLVEAGFDIVVVEQGEVAGGSTSANTALLLYETDVPLHRLAARAGARVHERTSICSGWAGDAADLRRDR
jgi:glycine/D-amino acid oxidase-like deaminating enzyme